MKICHALNIVMPLGNNFTIEGTLNKPLRFQVLPYHVTIRGRGDVRGEAVRITKRILVLGENIEKRR